MTSFKGYLSISQVLKVFQFFDRITFHSHKKLSWVEERILGINCNFFNQRQKDIIYLGNGNFYRPKGYTIEIVNPNKEALEQLNKLNLETKYVEVARNLIFERDEDLDDIKKYFDEHFIHSYHGKHRMKQIGATTYTGQRRDGRWFVWYTDHPCKVSNQGNCFHLEQKCQGKRACKQIGLATSKEFKNWWQINGSQWVDKVFNNLYEIDIGILGLSRWNQRQAKKRRRVTMADIRRGEIMVRAATNEAVRAQEVVDQYGHGPWLVKIGEKGGFPNKKQLLSL